MMRRVFLIPIFIVAGLSVFAWADHHQALPATGQEPQQYLSAGTPGLISAQAYLLAADPSYGPTRDATVPEPNLDASSALLYHIEDGEYLYEKNADSRLPIASLTKLLSVLVVQDLFDSAEVVTVASSSVRVDGQKQTLYDNERIAVKDLVSMMLVESSNDAAYALADYAKERGYDFVAKMNEKAYALGMRECVFTDPAGLDDTAYCTARDLVRLVRSALRQSPQIWPILATRELTVSSVDGKITHTVKSTDELLGQIPGIIGGKTGNTEGALGCLIIVVNIPDEHDTLVSIVLGSRMRFADTSTLLSWVQHAYNWQ